MTTFSRSCHTELILAISRSLLPVRFAAAGSVAAVAAVGPERVHPGVPDDAAGAGNAFAPLAHAVQLGRQLGFVGRRRGRFVQHADGGRCRCHPDQPSQPDRVGGRGVRAQFGGANGQQQNAGTSAAATQPEGPVEARMRY